MFSQASVILFRGGGDNPGQTLSSGADIPPSWADTPPADGHCSGRYASYWNAFLLETSSCVIYVAAKRKSRPENGPTRILNQSNDRIITRMHSSRMRTARSSSRLGGGSPPASSPRDQAPPQDHAFPRDHAPPDQAPPL